MSARDGLPPGAIVTAEVQVVGYLDPGSDGEMAYLVWGKGDVPLSTTIGLLELAKHDIISEMERSE